MAMPAMPGAGFVVIQAERKMFLKATNHIACAENVNLSSSRGSAIGAFGVNAHLSKSAFRFRRG
ncbi:hypothetical protein GGD61_008056 [Bradyrhizobium sp. SBR1B]|nr:hypothetical protein [Bradyrhizobium sp. SBR1B]